MVFESTSVRGVLRAMFVTDFQSGAENAFS